jgi:hypothetical protein
MDATQSRHQHHQLVLATTILLLLGAAAAVLQLFVFAAALIALAVVPAIAWFRTPEAADPDTVLVLPAWLVADLRQHRYHGGEVAAVRSLRERYPNLDPAQAARMVRML